MMTREEKSQSRAPILCSRSGAGSGPAAVDSELGNLGGPTTRRRTARPLATNISSLTETTHARALIKKAPLFRNFQISRGKYRLCGRECENEDIVRSLMTWACLLGRQARRVNDEMTTHRLVAPLSLLSFFHPSHASTPEPIR